MVHRGKQTQEVEMAIRIKPVLASLHRQGLLWCTQCLRDLTPDQVWIPDDMRDGRLFCFDCAPDDALRAKDL